MYATQRMRWYWSGGMFVALLLLIGLLSLFGDAPTSVRSRDTSFPTSTEQAH